MQRVLAAAAAAAAAARPRLLLRLVAVAVWLPPRARPRARLFFAHASGAPVRRGSVRRLAREALAGPCGSSPGACTSPQSLVQAMR